MKDNYKKYAPYAHRSAPGAPLSKVYPFATKAQLEWLEYRIKYNNAAKKKKACEPGDLYNEHLEITSQLEVRRYTDKNRKSMEPQEALEAYKSLSESSQDFIKEMHKQGLIEGLRAITEVRQDGKVTFPKDS